MDLYTFSYNNYYNRIVKKEDDLASYGTPTSTTLSVSFNPSDGVTTSQILNADPKGDYLVCALDSKYTDELDAYSSFRRQAHDDVGGYSSDTTVHIYSGGTPTTENWIYDGTSATVSLLQVPVLPGKTILSAWLFLDNDSGEFIAQIYREENSTPSTQILYKPYAVIPSGKNYTAYGWAAIDITDKYIKGKTDSEIASILTHEQLEYIFQDGTVQVETVFTEIKSRWFIMEAKRLRTGQYDLTLRRDLIADNYEAVISAPAFIEKATVSDDDPAIYNSEPVAFNKIKTSETLLTDRSGVSWIVGYLARNGESGTSTEEDKTIEIDSLGYTSADIEVAGISNWRYNRYVSKKGASFTETSLVIAAKTTYSYKLGTARLYVTHPCEFWYNGLTGEPTAIFENVSRNVPDSGPWYEGDLGINSLVQADLKDHMVSYLQSGFSSFLSSNYLYDETAAEDAESVLPLNGQTIKDTATGITYRIAVTISYTYDAYAPSSMLETANEHITECETRKNNNSYQEGNLYIVLNGTIFSIDLQEMPVKAHAVIKGDASRYSLVDQPFDMFCIPFHGKTESDLLYLFDESSGPTDYGQCQPTVGLHMAQAIAKQYGAYCYDIQLLPYCPVPELIKEVQDVVYFGVNKNIPGKFSPIWEGQAGTDEYMLSCIVWCRTSQFQASLAYPISVVGSVHESVNLDEYRVCSPNYNGVFDLSVAKNGGVAGFTLDCAYKPFSPYIHLAPVFGGLYGKPFQDARGLICGGDFSLSSTSDAWANYQLNNKNYQQSFDRQIDSLTFTNRIAEANSALGAVGGSFSGAASGFQLGGAAGAALGGALSIAAGTFDAGLAKTVRDEQLAKAQDLYGYSIQNIKAIPESLRKVDSYNPNNKIFPFVEYYTCTETERNAFISKTLYDGMTVGRIGTISEFLQSDQSYIKAQIIRLSDLGEDTHYINEIASEVNKGLYFPGE